MTLCERVGANLTPLQADILNLDFGTALAAGEPLIAAWPKIAAAIGADLPLTKPKRGKGLLSHHLNLRLAGVPIGKCQQQFHDKVAKLIKKEAASKLRHRQFNKQQIKAALASKQAILRDATEDRPLSNATVAPEGAAVILGLPASKFYQTPEWRAIRYQAFRIYGTKCMVCGRGRDGGLPMHVDHIRPRLIYPERALDIRNLQILCEDCNIGKDVVHSDDWRGA